MGKKKAKEKKPVDVNKVNGGTDNEQTNRIKDIDESGSKRKGAQSWY